MLSWLDPLYIVLLAVFLVGWAAAAAWYTYRRRDLEAENTALRAELHARIRAQYAQGWERVL